MRRDLNKPTTLADLNNYLKIAIPATAQTMGEWCLWEIMSIVAGFISPGALACHVAGMTVYTILFTIALGISSSAAQLVGNSLGEGRPKGARRDALLIVLYAVGWSVFVMVRK